MKPIPFNPYERIRSWWFVAALLITLGILSFSGFFSSALPAHAQSPNPPSDEETQRHLELASLYEQQEAWDSALSEYQSAAQSNNPALSTQAQTGISRILSAKANIWLRLKKEIVDFSLWLASSLIKLLSVFLILFLCIHLVFRFTSRRNAWIVLPFHDLTGSHAGDDLSEMLAGMINEMRGIHLTAAPEFMLLSEEVDLPSFNSAGDNSDMMDSLKAMDTLDISGIGLPMGSALVSVIRWIDRGQKHIAGSFYQVDDSFHLVARLHMGQGGKSGHKAWALARKLEGSTPEKARYELTEQLAYNILFDTHSGWGASSADSLRCFTLGISNFHDFQKHRINETENLVRASAYLEEAVSIDPAYVAARYNLAIVYINLGRYSDAINTLKSLRLIKNHALELEIAYNLGISYYHLLKPWAYDNAEEELQKVINADWKDGKKNKSASLYALACCALIGVCAQRMHLHPEQSETLFSEARQYYNQVLSLKKQPAMIHAMAYSAYGMALLNHDQAPEAAQQFEQAVTLLPTYWRAYIHWGRALIKDNKLEQAVLCLQQAVSLNPDYEFAQYTLGTALKLAAKFDEALDAYALASGIAQAHDERGSILAEHKKQYQSALVEFRNALRINPSSSNTLTNLAWYTLESGTQDQGELDQALVYARRAVELDPDNWHRYSVLGRVYLALGNLDSAAVQFEQSLHQSGSALQSYFYLSQVRETQGNFEEARQLLRKFLKKPQHSAWYSQHYAGAVDRLKALDGKIAQKPATSSEM